jgi:hypothetical protein
VTIGGGVVKKYSNFRDVIYGQPYSNALTTKNFLVKKLSENDIFYA